MINAVCIQAALNRDGTLPFEYPAVQASEDLDEIAESLCRLEEKRERILQSDTA
ncbi:hypothetical protein [Dictyobacter aurantiacus]|uniref:Uncharacterized protein n=1 Tax=Dictyobacter aurantiacus TaxID=1936993 RepID=A0A401Z9C6_9CHLR|nr:hypothetical protein [Dictyobacter aurantiacus]GCE03439.1 hypothetical protein KDAU_07680 [Dictyobacter aurantiacus]